MKCRRHPERWPDDKIGDVIKGSITDCSECLEILEKSVLKEIECGNIPQLSADFADRVIHSITHPPTIDNKPSTNDRRVTFIHYITAAAATIAMLLTGSFNTMLKSGPEYGDALNQFVHGMTKIAVNRPEPDEWSKIIRSEIRRFESEVRSKIEIKPDTDFKGR